MELGSIEPQTFTFTSPARSSRPLNGLHLGDRDYYQRLHASFSIILLLLNVAAIDHITNVIHR